MTRDTLMPSRVDGPAAICPDLDFSYSQSGYNPVYTMQSVVQPVGQPIGPTVMTTDCIVYTNIFTV